MIPLIDILIILSGVSAAQAGLMRRYTNTTTQASNAMTGVVYRPYAGSPSLSLGPIQGITALRFSQLLETPAGIPDVPSSTYISVVSSAASFQYQPLEPSSTEDAGASSSTYSSQNSGMPTSFWTFGNQEQDSTVTVTSTTYETVWTAPQAGESSSASAQESRSSGVHNTTTTSAQHPSRTFVFDPLPTSLNSASVAITETAATMAASESYRSPIPFPTTTPSAVPSHQTDDSESEIGSSSSTNSMKLPEVVTEGTPTTQSQAEVNTSESTAVPGITIVPQNPSVIYITVTDAGATTTVTA